MTTICTLASGSSGNATLISHGNTHILVDAGISMRRINAALKGFGLSLHDVSALLITHSHSDHVSALKTMQKHCDFPIYASDGTAFDLENRFSGIRPHLHAFCAGDRFSVGNFEVSSFHTAHDAPDSVCYRLDSESGSVGILTDTGYVTEAAQAVLQGVDTLILEANHDVETLKSGSYPYFLQQRILGSGGHLSNEDAAQFAVCAAESGTQHIILAHLSQDNNTPAMAQNAVRRALDSRGLEAVALSVAPRSECGAVYAPKGAVYV